MMIQNMTIDAEVLRPSIVGVVKEMWYWDNWPEHTVYGSVEKQLFVVLPSRLSSIIVLLSYFSIVDCFFAI